LGGVEEKDCYRSNTHGSIVLGWMSQSSLECCFGSEYTNEEDKK